MYRKLSNSPITLIIVIVLLVFCVFLLFKMASGGSQNGSGTGSSGINGSTTGDGLAAEPAVTEWSLPIMVQLTGSDSGAGLAAAWGFNYGIKTINETGGIRNLPVKITIRDAASEEDMTVEKVAELTGGSLAAVGSPDEVFYELGIQSFFDTKLAFLGAASNIEKRDEYKPFAISCVSDQTAGVAYGITSWLEASPFESVYIFHDQAGEANAMRAEEVLSEEGKEIVDSVVIGGESFDAASVAKKAFESGADAYYIDLSGTNAVRIIAQLKYLSESDATSLNILCGPRAASPDGIDEADPDMLGVRVWTSVDLDLDNAAKRKAFDDAFAKEIGDQIWYDTAVDYYQIALLIRQAIEAEGLTGGEDVLTQERAILAQYIYDVGLVVSDQGDYMIENGEKYIVTKIYTVSANGYKL